MSSLLEVCADFSQKLVGSQGNAAQYVAAQRAFLSWFFIGPIAYFINAPFGRFSNDALGGIFNVNGNLAWVSSTSEMFIYATDDSDLVPHGNRVSNHFRGVAIRIDFVIEGRAMEQTYARRLRKAGLTYNADETHGRLLHRTL